MYKLKERMIFETIVRYPTSIVEIQIVEYSPSGKYLKYIYGASGFTQWKSVKEFEEEYKFLENLPSEAL